jgi:hypothetical protein
MSDWQQELDAALSEKAELERRISRLLIMADLCNSGALDRNLIERRLEVRGQQMTRTNVLIAFIESHLTPSELGDATRKVG